MWEGKIEKKAYKRNLVVWSEIRIRRESQIVRGR